MSINKRELLVDASLGKLLAEVMLLQRWAGGDPVSLAQMFGLANSVESVLEEAKPNVISRETQDKVEDILDDVRNGRQDPDGMALKERLHSDGISETDAQTIMRLCVLENRFGDAVKTIAEAPGSTFSTVLDSPSSNHQWYGALHYLELFDESQHTPMLSVFSPCVPRIGETIETLKGSPMRVVDVRYSAQPVPDPLGGHQQRVLVPTVHLEPIDNDQ